MIGGLLWGEGDGDRGGACEVAVAGGGSSGRRQQKPEAAAEEK